MVTPQHVALPAEASIGPYRIEDVLGAGAWTITYLARDRNTRERVALREYFPELLCRRDEGGLAVMPVAQMDRAEMATGVTRFMRWARTVATVRHENVATVRRVMETNGTAYLATAFVDGAPLDALIRPEECLDPQEMAEILPGLLAGLEAIHRAGLYHRSLHPGAIFIRRDAQPVLDLPAADWQVEDPDIEPSAHVRAYASPELLVREDFGPWSDVYSLSATLFRLITGATPPAADTRAFPQQDRPDTIAHLLANAPGGWSPVLLDVIARGMALSPRARPPSVSHIRARLEERVIEDPDTVPSRPHRRSGGARTQRLEAPPQTETFEHPGPPAADEPSDFDRPTTPVRRPAAPDAIPDPAAGQILGGPPATPPETVPGAVPEALPEAAPETPPADRGLELDQPTRPVQRTEIETPAPGKADANDPHQGDPHQGASATGDAGAGPAATDTPGHDQPPAAQMQEHGAPEESAPEEDAPAAGEDGARHAADAGAGAGGESAGDDSGAAGSDGTGDDEAGDAGGKAGEGGDQGDGPTPPKFSTVVYRRGKPERVDLPSGPNGVGPGDRDSGAPSIAPARFTLYHPPAVCPRAWSTLVVYLHESGIASVIARQETERRAGPLTDRAQPRDDINMLVRPGAEMLVVPKLRGGRVNPPWARVQWVENFHRLEFRIAAAPDANPEADRALSGMVSFYAGALLVGETPFATTVAAKPDEGEPAVAKSMSFQRVFPSYAAEDTVMVERFAEAAESVNMPYLRQVLELRERGKDRAIRRFIERAERYQLCWSSVGSASPKLRREWEEARDARREDFIRICSWDRPMPAPPSELIDTPVQRLPVFDE